MGLQGGGLQGEKGLFIQWSEAGGSGGLAGLGRGLMGLCGEGSIVHPVVGGLWGKKS